MTFSRPGRLNRYSLEKSILEKSQGSVKPWEIENWTMSEVFLFLEDADARCPDGSPNMSELEIRAAAEAWAGMTASQRLRDYRW